jgi:hypothetical protein
MMRRLHSVGTRIQRKHCIIQERIWSFSFSQQKPLMVGAACDVIPPCDDVHAPMQANQIPREFAPDCPPRRAAIGAKTQPNRIVFGNHACQTRHTVMTVKCQDVLCSEQNSPITAWTRPPRRHQRNDDDHSFKQVNDRGKERQTRFPSVLLITSH